MGTGYRARSEVRDTATAYRDTEFGYRDTGIRVSNRDRSSYLAGGGCEHPKQEPCHYAAALAGSALESAKIPQTRARTVAPSPPVWRRAAPPSKSGRSSARSQGQYIAVRNRFI